jgi:hypothetical protein
VVDDAHGVGFCIADLNAGLERKIVFHVYL